MHLRIGSARGVLPAARARLAGGDAASAEPATGNARQQVAQPRHGAARARAGLGAGTGLDGGRRACEVLAGVRAGVARAPKGGSRAAAGPEEAAQPESLKGPRAAPAPGPRARPRGAGGRGSPRASCLGFELFWKFSCHLREISWDIGDFAPQFPKDPNVSPRRSLPALALRPPTLEEGEGTNSCLWLAWTSFGPSEIGDV